MKTLGTLQKLAKLGKIFSSIVFVFSLVGGILCAAGLISLLIFMVNKPASKGGAGK